MSEEGRPRYVLYVNKSYQHAEQYDLGSSQCLQVVDKLPPDVVLVQDIVNIIDSRVELPGWLDGTPTVVDTQTRLAHKGESAVTFCISLLHHAQTNASPDNIASEARYHESEQEEDPDTLEDALIDEEIAKTFNERSNKKPDEKELAKFMKQREDRDKVLPKPKASSLPPPLPAKS